VQGGGQGAAFVEQFGVQDEHQVGGKGVVHGIAHRQGRAAQAGGERLRQAGQDGGGGRRHFRALRAFLAGGRGVKSQGAAGGSVAAGAAVTGVEDEEFEPFGGQFQQVAQVSGVNRVVAAEFVFQQQGPFRAVAGEVDDVPARGFFEGGAQRFARGAVVEHAQDDGPALRLAQLARQALQAVALAAQVERIGAHGQAEGGQDADGQDARGICRRRAGVGGRPLQVVDEADAGAVEARPVGEAGQFEGTQEQGVGLRGQRHLDGSGRRVARAAEGIAQPTEDALAHPRAQARQARLHVLNGGIVVHIVAQVAEALVLAAGRVEMDVVVGQEAAGGVAEDPAPAGGVEVVGQGQVEGHGVLLCHPVLLDCIHYRLFYIRGQRQDMKGH